MKSAAPLSGAAPAPAPASILIVDDNPNQLVALEALLVPLGQRIVKASSGEEALRLLLGLDCALVLLDVHLPGIDGFEVARLMRERERTHRTPIIFLSGLTADAAFTSRGYDMGAVDFLFKPFDPQVLRAKVEVFVELYLHRERLKLQAERDKAETERARLLSLLVQTPAAIALTRGTDFVFEFANPLYEKVVGRSVPLGRPLREVLPEVISQPGVMEALRRAMRTGEPFVGREFPVTLDRRGTGSAEETFFDLVYQPLRDEHGEVTWLLTHAVEVTEQVRARRKLEFTEVELRQREAEFRGLAENIPDLVARFDRRHRLLYVNPVVERILGLPPERFPGRTMDELGMPLEKMSHWEGAFHEAFSGRNASLEFVFPTPSGPRSFEAHVVPERDDHGEVRSVLAVARDVTEARNREQALRESEGRFRLMAEASELLSSLEDRTVLRKLTELVVPRLADWAAVDLLSETGTVERVAADHCEPEKAALAFELARRWPIDTSHRGIGQVLRTGEPLLLEHLPDELLPSLARSEEHLRLARTLGFRSALSVPLLSRGRVLGALTLVHSESDRRFSGKDLPLVQELARRAGLAVDNALLYGEARGAQGRASRLQAVAAALSRAATPEDVARAILTAGLESAGTHAGIIYVREPQGGLRALHLQGYSEEVVRTQSHLPAGSPSPPLDVALAGEARWFSSAEELVARYPHLAAVAGAFEARAGLPLRAEEHSLGCLWLSFPDKRCFSPEERDFLTALAQLCSQALERARLFARALP
ncbi:PAS domain S-box-containing protein [Archangium gephyra]|uniref:PAS domain S-box-containing protein n=1 Tax=Archangium gephyra TaxID=48 RepID=A0AAC8QFD4_9BACT|nr:PAS domain-containing protein [Archangium gephyra]AKJ06723.1 Serine phosphatase RsbU, regulator of sigma subunit [Archangium gephyra]REG31974.1 PAS domain S-box-containing protein [Archangium gephyra]